MENPTKMDDLRVPLFSETSIPVFGFVQPSIPWLDSLHGFSMDALKPARQIR